MKKALSIALSTLAFGAASASASVTLNLFGGQLSSSNGNAIPDGGLILLVASTTDSIFSSPTPTASTSSGSFFGGDDYVLASFSVDSQTSGLSGGFAQSVTFNYSGNLTVGDSLQLYWFPTLTLSSTTFGENTSYGTYRTDSLESGSQINWTLPADGQTVSLQFLTQSAGGSIADSVGNASLTTVPEPSTTVALLGGAAGLFVIYRRRKQRASAPVSA